MATKARKRASAGDAASEQGMPVLEKIAGLLALHYVKDIEDKDQAALKLDAIGFTSREIAALLDVGTNYVNVARHRKSKKK
ncbi:hypothetical protein [Bradyrhizobium sp. SZCCHNS30591]|uniref:hypothetical protein n=2 Tax=unclassified Bradyrhizobium TaxID=2631580 RepID=UPI002916AFB5|nr:hypothetical protein [Bradyrhizobium sp. SZCCHNS30591]